VRGRLRVTTRVTGFERRRVHGQDLLGSETLDLPPTSIETTGIWLEIPDSVPAALKTAGGHPMGGLHAVEHAVLGLFPLFALCDRHDVGGITSLAHPQVGRAAIFLYDGLPGGMGLATSLFDRLETVLEATLELIDGCPCEEGCPACVHSPKCGSGNRPIDKAAAARALRILLGREPLPRPVERIGASAAPERPESPSVVPEAAAPSRLVFFDLETQRSAEEVGGWHNAHQMRLAVAVTWDTRSGRFECWRERRVHELVEHLAGADLVVGFNVLRFDYRVLAGYTDRELTSIPTFDLLEAIHRRLGFRLPLGHLAQENLGADKGGDGLQALSWWKEGRIEEIERYCRQDVALLRDLFDRALAQGHLLFRTKNGERVRLPTPWSLGELLERARSRPALSAGRGRSGERAPRGARSRAAPARGAAPAPDPR
jgi:DEAD/DEAH box helicase domain-containing protein